MTSEMTRTYWNGEPTPARRVRVTVGPCPSSWWCADLIGAQWPAVEVSYHGDVFYLDDLGGEGWAKVTEGRGGPGWPHKTIPVAQGGGTP